MTAYHTKHLLKYNHSICCIVWTDITSSSIFTQSSTNEWLAMSVIVANATFQQNNSLTIASLLLTAQHYFSRQSVSTTVFVKLQ